MSVPVRSGLGVLVAVLTVLGLGAGARATYSTGEADVALLRFSWRARSVLVEECRGLSEEEREALPVHMRRERICEGRIAPYRLRIDVDGERAVDTRVRGAGVREDRPIYVFRELRVSPGEHRVRVRFERVHRRFGGGESEDHESSDDEPGDEEARSDRNGERRTRDARDVAPPRMTFDTTLALDGGDIVLVTYDAERKRLVLRRAVATAVEGGVAGGTAGPTDRTRATGVERENEPKTMNEPETTGE